ncbi:MAG: cyclic nucleotide-binding domain-containing protein [Fibrobacter sp.]|nr:cyclic nucleotide-binding domain-containing protein [Fibrobacter sp.]
MASGEILASELPPEKRFVPAGSLVLKEGEIKRELLVVESGELTAFSEKYGVEKKILSLGAGSLTGTLSLLEGEAAPYSIRAVTDSVLTVVSEEDIYTLFRNIPVWLLAVIKKISAETRAAGKPAVPLLPNPLQSFARFLALRGEAPLNAELCFAEYSWLTQVSPEETRDLLQSITARRLAEYSESLNLIRIPNPNLLNVFAESGFRGVFR